MNPFIAVIVAIGLFQIDIVATAQATSPLPVQSTLEIYNIETGTRRIVYQANHHFEAPNWLSTNNTLIYNSAGKLFRISIEGGVPQEIDTDFATNCNNDHGISPDNASLVISHHDSVTHDSKIYTLPIEGGLPELVTQLGPSYWHGWSPDGQTLAYCAERNGAYDIYTIPVGGGNETQLTTADGLDDGPEFAPDGTAIYFNSVRTGTMQIWTMNPDGSAQQQITFDAYHDWFPHVSPDGKHVVFVSYEPEVTGHPANKNVSIRMLSEGSDTPQVLFKLFGGQGTINVPSWSADSKEFAFVSYKLR